MESVSQPVMWSETVGLRTRPVSEQKKMVFVLHAMVLALVLQVWCCVVKHGFVTLVVIMILKDSLIRARAALGTRVLSRVLKSRKVSCDQKLWRDAKLCN